MDYRSGYIFMLRHRYISPGVLQLQVLINLLNSCNAMVLNLSAAGTVDDAGGDGS